ncbi:hypothetical protein [Paracoccus aminovorans]|uniref:hypothetical protein n=1 Tax=Paracoccus aminovorans TaxID=34004 RepID=UPI002B2599B4|nr:hypothetical protein [Paracoccus aminovorans]
MAAKDRRLPAVWRERDIAGRVGFGSDEPLRIRNVPGNYAARGRQVGMLRRMRSMTLGAAAEGRFLEKIEKSHVTI